jgi:hypothetical protein
MPRLLLDATCAAGCYYDKKSAIGLNAVCLAGSLGSLVYCAPVIAANPFVFLVAARGMLDVIQAGLAAKRIYDWYSKPLKKKLSLNNDINAE